MSFLTETIPSELADMNPSLLQVCLRLLCAMLIGLIIGTEREYTHRPAGMRTHILVALGSCAITITGQLLFVQYKALGGVPDPARLSAQIIAGVGFLGAGTIMREGANVKGLTTAASLWTVAGLGIAAGFGYYSVAIAGMLFVFITLTLFEFLQHKLFAPHGKNGVFIMETQDLAAGLKALHSHANELRIDIHKMSAEQLATGLYRITFESALSGRKAKQRRQKFFDRMAQDPAIIFLKEAHDSVQAGK